MIRLLLLLVTYCCCCCCCVEASTGDCDACSLRQHPFFHEVNQCQGCCFSRAFPTRHDTLQSMAVTKPITSEASCCVHYGNITKVEVLGKEMISHTKCQCQACKHHKE